jgi:hypothetical protein
MPSTKLQLIEALNTPDKVDRDAGVIHGVKVLGVHSRNKGGYDYSPEAMKTAATLYEGITVNTNHPDRSKPNATRKVEDGIGWLRNCRVVEGDGVYADLHVLKTHPFAQPLFEAAERNPAHLGLSHNADGASVTRGGKRIVEAIERVRSVDLVGNPATNQTLFESEAPVTTKTTTIKAIFESTTDPALKSKRVKLLEMDVMADVAEMPVEVPAEGADSALSSDAATKAAFLEAIASIVNDDSLSWEETKTKVALLLDTMANIAGGDATTETETDAVTESLQEQVAALTKKLADKEADEANRDLLESKHIEVTPARLVTLKSVADKTVRAALLEDWVKATPKAKPGKPTYSAPLIESTDPAYKAPVGAKALAARYK